MAHRTYVKEGQPLAMSLDTAGNDATLPALDILPVLPFVLVLCWIIGKDDMTLSFDGFQIAVSFVAVLLVDSLMRKKPANGPAAGLLTTTVDQAAQSARLGAAVRREDLLSLGTGI
ncbi:hypothetical protein AYL99_11630 [Fonsecaea erecta]|uniref:Uncharacterized protein n=1 Tax=Fonsecaea erecta TaxID=1367422 RepID=A0A178Z4T5_9EURO|nr:hypothetical protein AYL99_11630 [Fonsecaea erecta]OAP54095.1 hypothetical protein AYL99_11630 [Fonsecaea erecta]